MESLRESEVDGGERARNVARWSERNGCRGRRLDPWLVRVALRPASLHQLGGERSHGRHAAHLTDGATLTFEGRYHEARGLELRQPVDPAIRPEFMVAGSSPAARTASQTLGARAVTYALPPNEEQMPPVHTGLAAGLRLGIIARADTEDAWRAAYTRFPPDRNGLARHLLHKSTGSHDDIPRLAAERAEVGTPYWTQPFESYQAMCPHLVGSHEEVSAALARYVQSGFGTFILDESESETDLENTRIVFDYARRNVMEAA